VVLHDEVEDMEMFIKKISKIILLLSKPSDALRKILRQLPRYYEHI